ncbi:antirepressor regulating drug resistance protein [Singulisphaera acidiphila DSM 18658]|uniref:Antirepressor regulating drug resistance protein n=1 Tax=Singulisphaera acidiphila (strain ATCC BAA-1392 / DSM 18658 / VKM B-2454 / MOB10) TaxID=886293 RepID=L0D939_SINAD|nr:antirepressor regulating drug resistance protein [Singulisphaera acidiphila DSM 18658]
MRSVESLNALSVLWANAMTRSLVDASLILAVVLLVWYPLRRRISSQMAYGLFLLVLLKAAFPVPVHLPAHADVAPHEGHGSSPTGKRLPRFLSHGLGTTPMPPSRLPSRTRLYFYLSTSREISCRLRSSESLYGRAKI